MKNLSRIFLFAFLFGIFSIAPKSLAASDLIDVVFDPIGAINQSNIAPGDNFAKNLSITNKTGDTLQLAMDVSLQQPFIQSITGDLSKVIFVKIEDAGGTTIFGSGGDKTIRDLSGNPFNFDSIGPNGVKNFKLIFIFDPNAGNEYQDREIIFDISAGIDVAEVIEQDDNNNDDNNDNDNNNDNNNNNNNNNPAPVSLARGLFRSAVAGEIQGTEIPSGENFRGQEIPEIAGVEESQCSEWPFWVWILMLVGYLAIINTNFYFKSKEKVRWFFPLVWTAGIFLIWYYFEKCRFYPWYPYVIIIIAIVSFFIYLSWFKKKIKQEGSEIQELHNEQ